MKRTLDTLQRHKLMLLGLATAACFAASLALMLLLTPTHAPLLYLVTAPIMTPGLVILVFILGRMIRFYNKTKTLLRRLVTGNYETGIKAASRWQDELTLLERLFNQLTDQLRQYDELRTRRIRLLRMTLDLTIQKAAEPMILYDVEKDTLTVNPAMQALLHGTKTSTTLNALRNQQANGPFIDMLLRTVEKDKSMQEGHATIQFPDQDTPQEVHVRIIPYRDKDDTVPLVVIFGPLPQG